MNVPSYQKKIEIPGLVVRKNSERKISFIVVPLSHLSHQKVVLLPFPSLKDALIMKMSLVLIAQHQGSNAFLRPLHVVVENCLVK